MFSGKAGDPMQQVMLCFNWCALKWMIYPSACNFSVAESNWKAGCVERHLSGLERGKGREALPIATNRKNIQLGFFELAIVITTVLTPSKWHVIYPVRQLQTVCALREYGG